MLLLCMQNMNAHKISKKIYNRHIIQPLYSSHKMNATFKIYSESLSIL